MGKVKTIIMGDEKQEEKARKKAETKRAQKKAAKVSKVNEVNIVNEEVKEEKKSKMSKKSVKSGKSAKSIAARALVDKKKSYSLSEAIDLVKKTSFSKFDGRVEIIINVTEKGLRGLVALPHGTGKEIRVKIADDQLVSTLEKEGRIDFDILVAHPAMMPKLAKIAKILGPKGLMPNPKTNTISEDPEKLAADLTKSSGWRTEPDFPIIHSTIGKVSFEKSKLEENFAAFVKAIGKDKIKSVFVKPTMGPAARVQI